VLRRLAGLAAMALLVLVALELGVRGLAAVGWLHVAPPPGFDEPYWDGDHAAWGVWRKPDAEFHHPTDCFDVTYRSNAVGARDVERPLAADGPRVLVLGDSFSDGWGVEREERFSDLLEQRTGVPHLNFAMPHFGPYQSYLVYRDLAKRWEHDAVLIGILPANDFVDMDPEWAREKGAGYLYRYRPYLVRDEAAPSGWRREDWREPVLERWLRKGSHLYAALQAAWRRLAPPAAGAPAAAPGGPEAIRSYFYDADATDLARLEHVLSLLAEEAGDRPVTVALIPGLRDLRRHAFSGPDPLTPRLQEFGRAHGIEVVGLLGPMAERSRRWSRYYLPCDYHLGPAGHAAVAELLAGRTTPPTDDRR